MPDDDSVIGDDPLANGMALSLRLRRDFTVTDADRLLTAARRTAQTVTELMKERTGRHGGKPVEHRSREGEPMESRTGVWRAPNGASEGWAMPDDGRKLVVEAVLPLPEVTGRRALAERACAEAAGERLA